MCPFSFSWGRNKEVHKSFYTYMSGSALAQSNGNSGLHLPFLFDQFCGRSRVYGLSCSLQVNLFGKLISCWVYCSHPSYQWHLLQYNLVFGHFLSVNIQHRLCCTQCMSFLCVMFNFLSLAPSTVFGAAPEVSAYLANKWMVKISDSGYTQNQIQRLTLTLIS